MITVTDQTYKFDKNNKPTRRVDQGEVALFKTLDCYNEEVTSEDFRIIDPDLTTCNPCAGPLFINGAHPGDVLMVEILDIQVAPSGFCMTYDNCGALHKVSEMRTKLISVKDGVASFNDVEWIVTPMVGTIGVTPDGEPVPNGYIGKYGGNMDSTKVVAGSKLYFPVQVEGALLQMGDIHASMGDGELTGTGIEISGQVLVRTSVIKSTELNYPVVETPTAWYVIASSLEGFKEAMELSCTELCRLVSAAYKWDSTDVFLYLGLNGKLEINASVMPGPEDVAISLRAGIPKLSGKPPLIK